MVEERYECKKCIETFADKGKAERHLIEKHFDEYFELFYDEFDL